MIPDVPEDAATGGRSLPPLRIRPDTVKLKKEYRLASSGTFSFTAVRITRSRCRFRRPVSRTNPATRSLWPPKKALPPDPQNERPNGRHRRSAAGKAYRRRVGEHARRAGRLCGWKRPTHRERSLRPGFRRRSHRPTSRSLSREACGISPFGCGPTFSNRLALRPAALTSRWINAATDL